MKKGFNYSYPNSATLYEYKSSLICNKRSGTVVENSLINETQIES